MPHTAEILFFPVRNRRRQYEPNRLRELRLDRGMTLEDVALEADCSIATIHGLEMGTRSMSVDWMTRLAPIFGVAPAELLAVASHPDALDPHERALIEALRKAPDANRAALLGAAEHLIGYQAGPEIAPLPSSRKARR